MSDGDAVLLFTEDMQGAVEEIASYHGALHVPLKLSTNIMIAHVPPGFNTATLKKSGTMDDLHIDSGALDKQSQLMLRAWKASQIKKDMSPTQGLGWDTPGYQPPGKADPLDSSAPPSTSLRMTGSIAVALIIVSGEPAELQVTETEVVMVAQGVVDAHNFLAGEEPAAKITFDIHRLEHYTVSRNKLVPGTGMSETPSAVLFNGKLYCFHQGPGQNQELWYNVFDGSTWAIPTKVGNTGITKWPCAVVYNGKIYCLHRGSTGLWWNVFDGNRWEGDKSVPNTDIWEGPSCVTFQGKLYCFHQGAQGTNQLRYNVFDGSSWEGDERVATSHITSGPSAVVFQSKLYCFYRGNDQDAELWYNVFNGSGWEGDTKVPDTSISASPSCVIHQGKLHCFHQGAGSNNGQLWCNIFDGSGWSGDIRAADVSMSQGPSTVVFQDQLYCFYQGPQNSGEMRYGTFDEVSYEGIWRDPALRHLGFRSGYAGCVDFANDLRQSSGADWSYVAFFTKYPLFHFAYARGVIVCMEYENDGWGPDQINRVFAHETCHVFGAADEYGSCKCSPYGFYEVNNGNCKNCTSAQVPCLMVASEWKMCSYSRGQVGWLPRSGLFVFHQGSAENGEMWYTVFDGVAWWRGKLVHETRMSAAPGALMVKNDVYAFHQGHGDNVNELWYNVLVDGKNWKGDVRVPDTGITASPSAVLFNNKIYCFHAGAGDSSNRLWYNVLDGAAGWVGDTQVPDTGTSLGPCATLFNNRVYCFHQGGGDNGELWCNVFDGSSWQGDKQIPNTFMSGEPSALTFSNKLYCFHQGRGNNAGELWYNVFDGRDWAGDKQIPTKTGMSEGPSTAILDGKLYCFFQGRGTNGEMWYTIFDGMNWSQDYQVPKTSMSIKPSAIFAHFTT